jgi:hypothetical protein
MYKSLPLGTHVSKRQTMRNKRSGIRRHVVIIHDMEAFRRSFPQWRRFHTMKIPFSLHGHIMTGTEALAVIRGL